MKEIVKSEPAQVVIQDGQAHPTKYYYPGSRQPFNQPQPAAPQARLNIFLFVVSIWANTNQPAGPLTAILGVFLGAVATLLTVYALPIAPIVSAVSAVLGLACFVVSIYSILGTDHENNDAD